MGLRTKGNSNGHGRIDAQAIERPTPIGPVDLERPAEVVLAAARILGVLVRQELGLPGSLDVLEIAAASGVEARDVERIAPTIRLAGFHVISVPPRTHQRQHAVHFCLADVAATADAADFVKNRIDELRERELQLRESAESLGDACCLERIKRRNVARGVAGRTEAGEC